MANVNVTVRIDKETKQEADTLFASLGLNLSTAVNIFLKKAVRTRSIPFEVSDLGPAHIDRNKQLVLALESVLASPEAQRAIGHVNRTSDFSAASLMSTADADQYLD